MDRTIDSPRRQSKPVNVGSRPEGYACTRFRARLEERLKKQMFDLGNENESRG